ncbi:MAG: ATP-binding protein [Pseudomonadota bacterium]
MQSLDDDAAETAHLPETLHAFFDAIPDLVLFARPDGRVVFVNEAFTRLTGYTAEEALGTMPGDLLRCDETDPAAAAAIDRAIAENTPIVQETVNARKNGEIFRAEVRMNPVRNHDGKVVGLLFVDRDLSSLNTEIARRTDAERESARLREQLRLAIESMPDGFVLYDDNDRLVLSNQRYREIYKDEDGFTITGMSFEALLRHDLAHGKFPDAVGREEAWVAERLARFCDPSGPFLQRLDDGTWLRILEKRTPDGFLVGLRTDVTELREKQIALEALNDELSTALAARDAAEARFFDIAAISADWFWEQDADLRFTYVSESLRGSTGVDPTSTIGRRRAELTLTEALKGYASDPAWLEERVSQRKPFRDFVYFFGHPDGGPEKGHWVRISGAPFFDAEGAFAGYRGTGSNITALLEARKRAEVADEAKSRFLATMSHEIRTPLTALLGHADLLRRKAEGAELAEHARAITEAGELLLTLVNDSLDIAKIEAGRLDLAEVVFRPDALLDRVARLHRARAEAKGLALEIHSAFSAEEELVGDEGRLIQVLNNLVGNAVTYTDRGGITLVALPLETGGVRFEVHDTGPGLAPAEAERLFDRFAQGAASAGRGGTGLGLAVVRQLVDLMNGTVDTRPATTQGTVMRVTLPLVSPAPRPPVPEIPQAETDALTGTKVLVVDDMAMNREVMRLLLAELGPEAVIVGSGQAALEAARTEVFDAYLLDISMPVMDGPETLKRLRALEQMIGRSPAKALAITANAFDDQMAEYRANGFDDVVEKPLTLDTLSAGLFRALVENAAAD